MNHHQNENAQQTKTKMNLATNLRHLQTSKKLFHSYSAVIIFKATLEYLVLKQYILNSFRMHFQFEFEYFFKF